MWNVAGPASTYDQLAIAALESAVGRYERKDCARKLLKRTGLTAGSTTVINLMHTIWDGWQRNGPQLGVANEEVSVTLAELMSCKIRVLWLVYRCRCLLHVCFLFGLSCCFLH